MFCKRCGRDRTAGLGPTTHCVLKACSVFRRRPYRVECTGSLSTSEVKRHRARLVLGWGTAWEDLRVLSAFSFPALFLLPRSTRLSNSISKIVVAVSTKLSHLSVDSRNQVQACLEHWAWATSMITFICASFLRSVRLTPLLCLMSLFSLCAASASFVKKSDLWRQLL